MRKKADVPLVPVRFVVQWELERVPSDELLVRMRDALLDMVDDLNSEFTVDLDDFVLDNCSVDSMRTTCARCKTRAGGADADR